MSLLAELFDDAIAQYAQVDAPLRRSIAQAARDTDTEPTHLMKVAGNYAKGKFYWNGLRVVIENPAGSYRSGVSEKGVAWRQKLAHAYGYLSAWKRLGLAGNGGVQKSLADGDNIDVFVGPDPESELVFVVDQHRRDSSFDEHKCLIGFHSETEAREAYLANYAAGWQGLRAITPMTLDAFKAWLATGYTGRPVAQYALTTWDDWKKSH